MTSRRTGRTAAAGLLAVIAVLAAGLVSSATAASSQGAVKGLISLDGKPVSFAKVQVYRTVRDPKSFEIVADPTRVKTDNTDGSGRYSLSGLAIKDGYVYTLVVADRPGKIVKAGRLITLKKGRTVTKNVRVKAAATLQGVVTTSDGRSPAGLTVGIDPTFNDNQSGRAFNVFYPDDSTTVRADGSFTLSGLPASPNYGYLQVSDDRFEERCYDFTTSALADCRPSDITLVKQQHLALTAGEVRTVPTVTMSAFGPPATKVAGTVTDSSGKALKGIRVRVDGAVSSVSTRSSGRFTVQERLREGPHTVRFDDPRGIWASQYLGGGPDLSVRQPVTITPGQPVRGLDVRLKSISTAKISTKVAARSAKVAFQIKRKASGSAPGGTITLSLGTVTKTVTVTKGKATVTLTGLPKGHQSLVATYSGTGSTAGFSKIVKVAVK